MSTPRRRVALMCTACALGTLALPARGQEPAASPSSRPISDSVDRVVEKLAEQNDPCREAIEKGVPCFPVSTTISGRTVSVRDSLYDLGPAGKPTPNRPPTVADLRPRASPSPIPFVTIDPGCVGKSFLKALKGKNDTYYVYRVRDVHGERVALYDHRLEAATFQGELQFVGRFEGECEALQAVREEERRLRAARGAAGDLARP